MIIELGQDITLGSGGGGGGGAGGTLQDAYDAGGAGTAGVILLANAKGVIEIRDSNGGMANPLFRVTDSASVSDYFVVDPVISGECITSLPFTAPNVVLSNNNGWVQTNFLHANAFPLALSTWAAGPVDQCFIFDSLNDSLAGGTQYASLRYQGTAFGQLLYSATQLGVAGVDGAAPTGVLIRGGSTTIGAIHAGGPIVLQPGTGRSAGGIDAAAVHGQVVLADRLGNALVVADGKTGLGITPTIGTVGLTSADTRLSLGAYDATGGTTLQSSVAIALGAAYWSAGATHALSAEIQHVATATTPTSKVSMTFGGTERAALTSAGVWRAATLDSLAAASLILGGANATGISLTQDTTLAAGKSLLGTAGAGTVDLSTLTGIFKTPTGAHTLNGAVALAAGKSFTVGAAEAIGTAQTVLESLQNTTAAAVGAQQFSPLREQIGQGWGTTAGTSQTLKWATQVRPVQGTVPSADWVTWVSLSGAAYAEKFAFRSGGLLTYGGTSNSQQGLRFGSNMDNGALGICARLADDSGNAPIQASNVLAIGGYFGAKTAGSRYTAFVSATGSPSGIALGNDCALQWDSTNNAAAGTPDVTLTRSGTGQLKTACGRRLKQAAKSGAYTLTLADCVIEADTSGAAWTLTLPAPATAGAGAIYRVVDAGGAFNTNNLTLARNGAEKINGTAANVTFTLANAVYTIYTNGTDWWVTVGATAL